MHIKKLSFILKKAILHSEKTSNHLSKLKDEMSKKEIVFVKKGRGRPKKKYINN